ncbi:hypothetical protein J6590_007339 [Homalodisca vitripennis]|nr:hypothetical protein J6590_007339 [Homalodisca vitripennis]
MRRRGRSPFKPYSVRPHGPLACARILSNRIRRRVDTAGFEPALSDPKSNDFDRSAIGTPKLLLLPVRLGSRPLEIPRNVLCEVRLLSAESMESSKMLRYLETKHRELKDKLVSFFKQTRGPCYRHLYLLRGQLQFYEWTPGKRTSLSPGPTPVRRSTFCYGGITGFRKFAIVMVTKDITQHFEDWNLFSSSGREQKEEKKGKERVKHAQKPLLCSGNPWTRLQAAFG